MSRDVSLKIFLCGDVMIGRGIDQILSHPVEPQIYESYVKDARDYVSLAEEVNESTPRWCDGKYILGATKTEPGVWLLDDLSSKTIKKIKKDRVV
ncbi:hypothetical protein [Legionella fallonii]|uniref:Capsule biosynthesis protein CapA n=1 Tax=Legionella fallonii LLAP-10 TaxID=1212491 RepID=A0A098G4P5_9GAMM|nr:hypothetical protein [Legionella fallonii]CEG56941.1 protein of unknown function [Legionella fallonii LLAP-10]